MTQQLWADVDHYVESLLVPSDATLEETLRSSHAAGLPSIQVTPPQGKFLHLLARAIGAQRVLEIGTLGGYSTIWLARALPPEGRLVTLELSPRHAEVARANIERAGLSSVVTIMVGPAMESLDRLARSGDRPFDLIFVDADKPNITEYVHGAERLSRPGSVIVVDNVVREGGLLDATSPDPAVQGVRRFVVDLARDPFATGTVLQTVSEKKHDGFALLVVDRPRV